MCGVEPFQIHPSMQEAGDSAPPQLQPPQSPPPSLPPAGMLHASLHAAGQLEALAASAYSRVTPLHSIVVNTVMLAPIAFMLVMLVAFVMKRPFLQRGRGAFAPVGEWQPVAGDVHVSAMGGGRSYNTFAVEDENWRAAKEQWHAAIHDAKRAEPPPNDRL